VIPPSAFLTTDGRPGLIGEYFAGMKFDSLVHSQRDTMLHFEWSAEGAPGVGKEDFSVRWTGQIRVPETGRYEFEAMSDDGVNLFVGDSVL
jgi:alpha-D-xyloside xylohydrolase